MLALELEDVHHLPPPKLASRHAKKRLPRPGRRHGPASQLEVVLQAAAGIDELRQAGVVRWPASITDASTNTRTSLESEVLRETSADAAARPGLDEGKGVGGLVPQRGEKRV